MKDLTSEVSNKDARFLSIANSGVHNNDNVKVSPPINSYISFDGDGIKILFFFNYCLSVIQVPFVLIS